MTNKIHDRCPACLHPTHASESDDSGTCFGCLVTDEQIERLLIETGSAGDYEQAQLCRRALASDDDARIECGRAITAAAAMWVP